MQKPQATREHAARGFSVEGYVRNLADGRVEVVAEGSPEQVGGFLSAVEELMAGYIRERRASLEPATGEFDGFGVRF